MTTCPYPQICNNPNCEKEPFQRCFIYQQLVNQQLDTAVQFYIDEELTSEDILWISSKFKVPLNKLERMLEKL